MSNPDTTATRATLDIYSFHGRVTLSSLLYLDQTNLKQIGDQSYEFRASLLIRIRFIQVTPSTTALCDRFRFSLNSKTFLIVMA